MSVNYQNSPADGVRRQDIKKFTNPLQTRFKTDKILALSDKLILIRKKRPVKDTQSNVTQGDHFSKYLHL